MKAGFRAATGTSTGPRPDRAAVSGSMERSSVNELLAAVERGESAAWEQLMALVYEDLKRIAHGQMARIVPDQTLSTTVLVHEAFEKLAAQQRLPVREHSAFYALCACAMRQIIIDHYRKRAAGKRSTEDPLGLAAHETGRVNPEADNALIALGRVLSELVQRDKRLVEVFEMRYFAGLSDAEIARRLDISTRSVQRLATRARAWITAALDA